MKKINDVLIFLVILISVCFAIKDFNIGAYDRLLGSLSIAFVLFIPRIVRKLFKIKISNAMEFIYILFIFLAQFLGSVVNLYNKVWWYDLFMHFISGILTSFLALEVLCWFNNYKEKNKIFNALFIISLSLMIAVLWEFCEFTADTLFGMNVQHNMETGVKDTMQDMLVAFLGSIIVSVLYLIKTKVFKKIVSD